MRHFTSKDLTREARAAIRSDAKAAGVRARYVGWKIAASPYPDTICLVAEGVRADGHRFTVNVAI